MFEFEIKTSSGKTFVWNGNSGIDAAKRFVSAHPEETVIAWRDHPRKGMFIANISRVIG